MYMHDGPDDDDHDGHHHPADGRAVGKKEPISCTLFVLEIGIKNYVTKLRFKSIGTLFCHRKENLHKINGT